MKPKEYLDKITYSVEIAIALLLLIVVLIRFIEIAFELAGVQVAILAMDFQRVLSISLTLVICVEFIKMLYKHTPETVIDVLLFAIARQIVIYHERTVEMLIGVVAIIGLFAAKKFLLGMKLNQH